MKSQKINRKIKDFLYNSFGIEKPRKTEINIKCGVGECEERAIYQKGDGLLSFWFVCEKHKNIIAK